MQSADITSSDKEAVCYGVQIVLCALPMGSTRAFDLGQDYHGGILLEEAVVYDHSLQNGKSTRLVEEKLELFRDCILATERFSVLSHKKLSIVCPAKTLPVPTSVTKPTTRKDGIRSSRKGCLILLKRDVRADRGSTEGSMRGSVTRGRCARPRLRGRCWTAISQGCYPLGILEGLNEFTEARIAAEPLSCSCCEAKSEGFERGSVREIGLWIL